MLVNGLNGMQITDLRKNNDSSVFYSEYCSSGAICHERYIKLSGMSFE